MLNIVPATLSDSANVAVAAIRYRTIPVDGVDLFYREAGRPDAPAVVLLHGFPTSSQMFRNLMPLLELAMAFYYAYFIWLAVERELWSWMPFLLLFLVGFGYVSLLSIFQRPLFFKWMAPRAI